MLSRRLVQSSVLDRLEDRPQAAAIEAERGTSASSRARSRATASASARSATSRCSTRTGGRPPRPTSTPGAELSRRPGAAAAGEDTGWRGCAHRLARRGLRWRTAWSSSTRPTSPTYHHRRARVRRLRRPARAHRVHEARLRPRLADHRPRDRARRGARRPPSISRWSRSARPRSPTRSRRVTRSRASGSSSSTAAHIRPRALYHHQRDRARQHAQQPHLRGRPRRCWRKEDRRKIQAQLASRPGRAGHRHRSGPWRLLTVNEPGRVAVRHALGPAAPGRRHRGAVGHAGARRQVREGLDRRLGQRLRQLHLHRPRRRRAVDVFQATRQHCVLSVGQGVSQGQVIGYSGCTGHCFGPHVPLETARTACPSTHVSGSLKPSRERVGRVEDELVEAGDPGAAGDRGDDRVVLADRVRPTIAPGEAGVDHALGDVGLAHRAARVEHRDAGGGRGAGGRAVEPAGETIVAWRASPPTRGGATKTTKREVAERGLERVRDRELLARAGGSARPARPGRAPRRGRSRSPARSRRRTRTTRRRRRRRPSGSRRPAPRDRVQRGAERRDVLERDRRRARRALGASRAPAPRAPPAPGGSPARPARPCRSPAARRRC